MGKKQQIPEHETEIQPTQIPGASEGRPTGRIRRFALGGDAAKDGPGKPFPRHHGTGIKLTLIAAIAPSEELTMPQKTARIFMGCCFIFRKTTQH
jgi:hypothetical protein